MNINFLPAKLKEEIKKLYKDLSPLNVARSSGNIDGETGEGYLVALKDKLVFFSRKTGENDFIAKEANKEIAKAKIRKEGFNIFLDATIAGKDYKIRFPSLEEADIAKIAEIFFPGSGEQPGQKTAQETASEIPADKISSEARNGGASGETKITGVSGSGHESSRPQILPQVLFAAAMMFIAKSDESVGKEEDFYVIAMLNYNKKKLQKALEYFKTTNFDMFINDCKILNSEQKYCILANMLEIAMKDAKFTGKEQKMIDSFVNGLKIEPSEYATIRDVLFIKNKTSIFDS